MSASTLYKFSIWAYNLKSFNKVLQLLLSCLVGDKKISFPVLWFIEFHNKFLICCSVKYNGFIIWIWCNKLLNLTYIGENLFLCWRILVILLILTLWSGGMIVFFGWCGIHLYYPARYTNLPTNMCMRYMRICTLIYMHRCLSMFTRSIVFISVIYLFAISLCFPFFFFSPCYGLATHCMWQLYIVFINPSCRAVRVAPFSNRLAHAVPSNVQGLRCLANFEALRFSQPIKTLAEKMVDRMIKNSSHSGGKYVSVHLRFEEV